MEKTSFGQRLRTAFGNAKYAQIAEKMGVSEATIKVYMAGRVPDAEKLLLIRRLTNCNLDWLLSGEGAQFVTLPKDSPLHLRLIAIAIEQADVIFADADIAGTSRDHKTLDLLTDFLVWRSMVSYGLADPAEDVLSKADRKRAEKFTFIHNLPQSIDDRILSLIEKSEKKRFTGGTAEEFRDMIRTIIKEELKPKKVPVYPLDLGEAEEKTRRKKTG